MVNCADLKSSAEVSPDPVEVEIQLLVLIALMLPNLYVTRPDREQRLLKNPLDSAEKAFM